MKKNDIKKITLISSTIAVAAAPIAIVSTMNNTSLLKDDTSTTKILNSTESTSDESKYPIYPSQSNGQNSFLSTKMGPIIYSNNTLTALDWFGGRRWEINMEDVTGLKDKTYGSIVSWKRSWYNWDYDQNRDILWVLSFGWADKRNKFKQQKLYSFDGITGNQTGEFNLDGEFTEFKFISALVSGNVLIYGGATSKYDGTAQIYNAKTKQIKKIDGNSEEGLELPEAYKNTSKWYFFNVIPIAENRNIVELMNFPDERGTTGDGSASKASFQVDFLLVDDEMNFVTRESSNKWSKQVTAVPNGVKNFRNTTITPQRDYYFLLDGKVVTIIYNTIVIIDPNAKGEDCNVSIKTYQLDSTKWVMSWSFDTNENLFYKYKDDTTIYRVKASELKNNSSSDVSPATYYALANSTNEEVKKNASNYILYNVYGYQGQIMLINSWYHDTVATWDYTDTILKEQYGLAVAVVQNEHNPEIGDVKGILNGEKSFQRSADFDISEHVLKSKIPSEITKNDLTITNDGFLTQNKTTENGILKYPPFKIENINDEDGSFEVTAYIDQIPWFANTLPSDSIPNKITKKFNKENSNNAQPITEKVSWKNESEIGYDFKNTLPSKISQEDLNNFDPFQVSFSSQTILDSKGNQLYPQKTYSASTRQDSDGTIAIDVDYKYIPMGVVYEGDSSVKHYKATHTYKIFSESQNPEFYFAGSNKNASSNNVAIDITKVPQLKVFSQSNLLPSSFENMDKSLFVQFIDTNRSKGYPLSKMNFRVEANDSEGTLTVYASLIDGYYENKPNVVSSFSQVYTGLNKTSAYGFSFNTNATMINNKSFSTMLPSAVNEGDIIKNLVSYKGFNSSDFTVSLFPNNVEGKLYVEIDLNHNYANELGNAYGFKNYKITHEFSGFMTTENYNNQYTVKFKDNNNADLASIKQMTLSNIYHALVPKNNQTNPGLTINGKTYDNLKTFIQDFLIEYSGDNIPKGDWKNNPSIDASMTYDNNAGTMNILLTIKKEALSGLESDLNIVKSYSGFAKGNMNETDDNLSFVDNDLLKSVVSEANNVSASEFETWLKEKPENFNKIVSYVSGIYKQLIDTNNYTLTTKSNDAYGTLSIIISFDRTDVSDINSLLTYSIQYTNLFK